MPKRSQNPGNNAKQIEQLNRAVDVLLTRMDGNAPKLDADVAPLLRIAADLRSLPRSEFKARLKSELLATKEDKKKEGGKTMSTVAEPVAAVRTTAAPRIVFKDTAKAI